MADELLAELARLEVDVWAEGERLRYRARRGSLSDRLRERLAALKPELLALLQQRDSQPFPQVVPDPGTWHEPFPLTDLQQAYLVGRSGDFEMGNVAPHFYLEVEFASLDVERLGAALCRLIDRHGMLRAIFLPDGRQQILAQVPPYVIETLDLTRDGGGVLAQRLDAVRQQMSHEVRPPESWPVFSIRATYLPGGRARLHMSFDLLLGDVWSFQMFFRELFTLYQEPGLELPDLTVSFRDYVVAARAFEETSRYKSSLEYWRARLRDLPPAPDLPLAVAAHSLKAPRFTRLNGSLDFATWSRLKQRALHFGLTPSGVLLAAFAEVLAAWSRTPRFTLNLTFFNRLPVHPQIGRIMGDFSSTLLLALDLQQPTFAERAAGVQQQLWSDMEHGRVSGVWVLRELARTRRNAPRPRMPVVFTSALGNPAEEGQAMPPSVGEPVYGVSQTPQVWLDHRVFENERGLLLTWDAVEELFPEAMVQEMFASYCALLERLTEGEAAWREPARRAIPEAQLARRAEVNATGAPIPEELLQTPFFEQALRHPERPAVLGAAREVPYGELAAWARSLGRHLRDVLGARPNRLVAVMLEKGWEQAAAVLGVLVSGAAYLPIDPALPRERRFYLLAHGEVEIVLTQSRLDRDLEWPPGVTRLAVDLWKPSEAEEVVPPAAQSAEDLAYVIFTSGSTGLPKGVMIDHRGALNTVIDVNRRFAVGPGDRVLALSALSFDLSVWDLFGLLAAGGAVVLPELAQLRDPKSWVEAIRRWEVTVWNTVPALMEMLVEYLEGRAEAWPESLRLVLLSGDWIPTTLPGRIRRLAPDARVVSLGGATEASIWSILYPIGRVDPEWKSIPYGRPMVNQRFHVLDERCNDRPDWVPGQLFIGGVGLARGYWRDEEKTRASFISHPVSGERLYRTGDLGRWLPEGTIEFLGREDSQVKVQGYRVELGEIEAVLSQCPGVHTAVVTAVGEPRGGKRLVGYAVPVPGAALHVDELRERLRARLPEYMVPASLRILESLPLTANGKVDRAALPDPLEPAPAERQSLAGPVAEKIAALLMQCLRTGPVAVDADLRELGATSVDMIWMANLLEKELGFRPGIDQFYTHPTASGLAELYAEQQGATSSSPRPAPGARDVWSSFDLVLDPEARQRFKERGLDLRSGDEHRSGVQLPAAGPLEETRRRLESRRTWRSFSREIIPFDDFAGLLGCLPKLRLDGEWKHFYPSAGGLYPIQVYLHVKPGRIASLDAGTYYYQPVEHRLVELAAKVEIERTIHTEFVNRPVFDEAAFSLFLVAQVRAVAPLYGSLARDLSLIEAGAMVQLLMMQAAGFRIGLCPVGGLEFARIRQHFLLEDTHEIVHSLLGGGVSGLPEAIGERPSRLPETGEREQIEL